MLRSRLLLPPFSGACLAVVGKLIGITNNGHGCGHWRQTDNARRWRCRGSSFGTVSCSFRTRAAAVHQHVPQRVSLFLRDDVRVVVESMTILPSSLYARGIAMKEIIVAVGSVVRHVDWEFLLHSLSLAAGCWLLAAG